MGGRTCIPARPPSRGAGSSAANGGAASGSVDVAVVEYKHIDVAIELYCTGLVLDTTNESEQLKKGRSAGTLCTR